MDKHYFLKIKAVSSIETLTLLELMKNDKAISPEQILCEYGSSIRSTIRAFARRFSDVLDIEDLKDIEQEVYLRIIHGCLNNYRGETSLKNYICGYIVRSAFYDFIRNNITPLKEPTEDIALLSDIEQAKTCDIDPIAHKIEQEEIVRIIEEEVANMTDTRKKIYRLIVEEGMTQEEAGKVLGLSQSTISEHFTKIVAQIRSALRKKFPEYIP